MANWNRYSNIEKIGGIYLDQFKNQAEVSQLSCPLCKQILRKPVEFKCGCQFCDKCINDYVCDQRGEVQCPSCEETYQNNGLIQPSFSSRKAVEAATVFCEHRRLGCHHEMKYKDLQYHLDVDCDFYACHNKIYGCEVVLSRTKIGRHMDNSCSFWPKEKETRYWGLMTVAKNHRKDCRREGTLCPNNCRYGKLHPSKIADHLRDECPQAIISCQYQQYGCIHQCKRREMDLHIDTAKENHQLLQTVTGRMEEMKMEFNDGTKVLEQKIDKLEGVNEETKALKRKIDDLEGRLADYEQNNPRRRHRAYLYNVGSDSSDSGTS